MRQDKVFEFFKICLIGFKILIYKIISQDKTMMTDGQISKMISNKKSFQKKKVYLVVFFH
ncbi:hypothetical protein BpHYR1_036725 [Brachionus plicatilis]|uniref:Uncharacterized protein n=1 Tax=Brachionus plicatilis TaxID=10195 RepID=A0A3M7RLB9_BRAPC|nr:hypothetical protein BpHYR1_036725 [Brachionus plicatilis]